ncbi:MULTISPECIES: hypothetical protein [Paraburkholderia]|uniref:WD40/YVTN/BNR-like repeat-containing protein n=1 Tax=Paraburkholderia TaxID=1822464 RepID=UPI002253A872|nr:MULTISPECIES: hypothetical protein [Paraburkholderia]MCX4163677.1 hypothetical protein [Paraburkholderia megapolitana]MDN7159172.1 hypothetical protein [Paraburkholderia sp. CHISQ3]MDQ6496219.1 hypothetical protein [Paraburkholderia megapolitana]
MGQFCADINTLVALVTLPGEQPADTRYGAIRISQGNCRVLSTTDLGNPDYLVELGWSPVGRWWIVGSNLNTLLRSGDGEHWTDAKLPSTISELVSAYVANDDVIWLAAIDSTLPLAAGPLIVRSQDAGKTWTPLKWGDPLLREVPSAWLEGQMRVNGKERN